jgi:hypothetical protein
VDRAWKVNVLSQHNTISGLFGPVPESAAIIYEALRYRHHFSGHRLHP